jgi:L-fucose isomerase-like protein
VRFSEKLLEEAGISVDVIDMVDVLGRANKLSDLDSSVQSKIEAIRKYADVGAAPASALMKMAKFGVVLDNWIAENDLVGTAVQCWTGLEEYFGITPCTLMSMMGNNMKPSACEVDVAGVIAMYALQLASGRPSAIVDWNNNYADDEDKCVLWHCANYPKDFYEEKPKMDDHAILGLFFEKSDTWGSLQGRIKAGPCTLLRMSTDDQNGKLTAYVAQGRTTQDPAHTWGGLGVVQIPKLERLLRFICEENFEHHVSINLSAVGPAITDALQGYLGWEVYAHELATSASEDRAGNATA